MKVLLLEVLIILKKVLTTTNVLCRWYFMNNTNRLDYKDYVREYGSLKNAIFNYAVK